MSYHHQYNSWKLIDDKAIHRQLLVTWEMSFSLYNIPWQSTRFVAKLCCCCEIFNLIYIGKFENKDLVKNNRRVSPDFLINSDGVLSPQDRPQEDIISFTAWFKALFDSNSEGIEDTILR